MNPCLTDEEAEQQLCSNNPPAWSNQSLALAANKDHSLCVEMWGQSSWVTMKKHTLLILREEKWLVLDSGQVLWELNGSVPCSKVRQQCSRNLSCSQLYNILWLELPGFQPTHLEGANKSDWSTKKGKILKKCWKNYSYRRSFIIIVWSGH